VERLLSTPRLLLTVRPSSRLLSTTLALSPSSLTMLVSSATRGACSFFRPSSGKGSCWFSFKNLGDKEWDQITEVHLHGAFACTKAAWPLFRKQKFGRVINTASAAGIYGASGSFDDVIEHGLNILCRQLWPGQLLCCQDGSHWIHQDIGA